MGTSNKYAYIQILREIEQIVFNIGKENIGSSVQQTMNFFPANFPYSFNVFICMLIHTAFSYRREEINTFLVYLKLLQRNEEEVNIDNPKIIYIFVQYRETKLKNHITF